MKRLLACIILATLVSGCSVDWSAAISVGKGIKDLRDAREDAGKPHIEDIFKSEVEK